MSQNIEALLDKNFEIPDSINRDGITFYDAKDLDIYGLKHIDGKYCRMSPDNAAKINEKIFKISRWRWEKGGRPHRGRGQDAKQRRPVCRSPLRLAVSFSALCFR